jgi:uncharacterized protein with PIN domain
MKCPKCDGSIYSLIMAIRIEKKPTMRAIDGWKYCPKCDAMYHVNVEMTEAIA